MRSGAEPVDYLVCPADAERVKVLEPNGGPAGRLLVRCPRCGTRYVFTSSATLQVVEGPDAPEPPG
ncbi:MAG: hypothetical protein ACR2N4_13610 [Jatrophihabitans sp.]